MKPKQPTVSDHISTHPIYKAIVKAVGYGMRPCSEVIGALKDVISTHGQPAVDAAGRDLLDVEQCGGVGYARIQPSLHNACRMLLGPTPAEWPTWWLNADGTERPGKPKVWPPVLPGPPAEKEVKAKPAHAPIATRQQLWALTEKQLADRLRHARKRYNAHSPNSKSGHAASRAIDELTAEYRRRCLTMPVPSSGERSTPRTKRTTKRTANPVARKRGA